MVTDADRLLRPKLILQIVKPVFHGLLHQKVVSIDYQKKNLQEGEETIRSISPNHIVFADDRYHLRAYCHKKDTYLDFVLSRIVYSEISKMRNGFPLMETGNGMNMRNCTLNQIRIFLKVCRVRFSPITISKSPGFGKLNAGNLSHFT
jgi:hypothetical protein